MTSKCPHKLLVVEDDSAIRESIVLLLQAEGYEADQASDGKQALEYLHKERVQPCLVITDLFMPFDGNELIKLMKQQDQFVTIPVVVVSAAIQRKPPNAVVFIKKPFGIEELMKHVKQFCTPKEEGTSTHG